jgi:quinol monooxygenase YgiN
MKEIVNAEDIHRMRKEKQALEQGLAMDLLEIFNDERAGLIQQLRALVGKAVEAPADPEGCLLFDRITDRKQWETFSRSNERFLEKFRTVSAWPRKMEVRRIPYA